MWGIFWAVLLCTLNLTLAYVCYRAGHNDGVKAEAMKHTAGIKHAYNCLCEACIVKHSKEAWFK